MRFSCILIVQDPGAKFLHRRGSISMGSAFSPRGGWKNHHENVSDLSPDCVLIEVYAYGNKINS